MTLIEVAKATRLAHENVRQLLGRMTWAGEKTVGDCLAQLAAERMNNNVIARAALAEMVDFMVGDA
jgi:ethanolamine ammonia-lyase large subunit